MGSQALALDAACAARASTQYGLITRSQAESLGLSRHAIHRRAHSGLLISVYPGVYRYAAVPRSWHQRAMATHLWAGASSLISGHAAAALHHFDGFALPRRIDIWTPRSLKAPDILVVPHRTEQVEVDDRTEVGGIPVMTPGRTLIDVAGRVTEERLEIALEDILRRRLSTSAAIAERVGRMPRNCRGARDLRTVLTRRGAAPPAESGLEVKVIRLLRRQGYPDPIRQRVLNDEGRFIGRVDLVYPERRLILEVDSFRFHSGRGTFEHDRSRRNALTALGWFVLHITHLMMRDQLETFLEDLDRIYHRPL